MITWLLAVLVPAYALRRLAGPARCWRLPELHLPDPWLLLAAVSVQLVLVAAPLRLARPVVSGLIVVVATVAAGWAVRFVTANRIPSRLGLALLLLGLATNTLVVAINGYMPVAEEAEAGMHGGTLPPDHVDGAKHAFAADDTHLASLGDWVLLPGLDAPVLPKMVVSPGDLLVLAGLALLVVAIPAPERDGPGDGHRAWLGGRGAGRAGRRSVSEERPDGVEGVGLVG